jgi:hypothetical protein
VKEETLVIELEDKICQLSRDNMKLKTKLANTRSLLSAKSPKQNNPMIPVTRRPPTIKKSVQDKPGSEIRHNELESQEVQRLNALVNMLRSKLLDLESEKSDVRSITDVIHSFH